MRIKILVYISLELLDILSGIIKTLANDEKLKSAKMASGLYKKTGNAVCLATAYVLSMYMYDVIQINLFDIVWLYTSGMNTISIFENVGSPKMIEKVKELFKNEL